MWKFHVIQRRTRRTTKKRLIYAYFYNIYNSEFSEELNSEENYFFLDRHPNKFGHRKIAQSLYNVLKSDIFNN